MKLTYICELHNSVVFLFYSTLNMNGVKDGSSKSRKQKLASSLLLSSDIPIITSCTSILMPRSLPSSGKLNASPVLELRFQRALRLFFSKKKSSRPIIMNSSSSLVNTTELSTRSDPTPKVFWCPFGRLRIQIRRQT